MSEVFGNNQRIMVNPQDIGIMAMMLRLFRGVPGITGGPSAPPRFRTTGIPYRGKDRNPQPKHSHTVQKSPWTQYGPMARRRRQIERGILTESNGLFCAR